MMTEVGCNIRHVALIEQTSPINRLHCLELSHELEVAQPNNGRL